jgi:RNA polymerase sigma factor (sigma-70 family)
MLKVKDGDIDKMGLLFERYHRQLFRFIFHMTNDKVLSEDMVQNAFLRMLKYRKNFAGTGEFRNWMYHVARNTMNDHFRRNRYIPSQNNIADLAETLEGEQTSDGQLEKQQELGMLESAMKKLSDENRELLILYRYQELNYHDIALILNTTEGAVKVRVHRAMNQLRSNFLKINN